ncbi:MAG: hypothetical protein FWF82_04550 [Oscillospiraceae bacterium]|nr:hypothetical protein [Oscillospiraceae bacterium]
MRGGRRRCPDCNNCGQKKSKTPIAIMTFGGALVCFCFISSTFLIVTVGVTLIVLGVYLLKNY